MKELLDGKYDKLSGKLRETIYEQFVVEHEKWRRDKCN